VKEEHMSCELNQGEEEEETMEWDLGFLG